MTSYPEGRKNWTARLLIGLCLVLAGAAAATWGLARYDNAAQLLGVAPPPPAPAPAQPQPVAQAQPLVPAPPPAGLEVAVADLQARLQRVENAAAQAQGSAGRADALLVAFAARRSIERGAGLGYLEPLLLNRFGSAHPQATAAILTAARSPVRLTDLVLDYEKLRPALLAAGPGEGLFTGLRRELSSLVHVHRADRPSTQPQARFERALAQLNAGQVDAALAETMRLPGAARAGDWTAKARRYVAARRALDEIESAALLERPPAG